MEMNEKEFMRRLKETFQIEAKEHLDNLSKGLISIENASDNTNQKELLDGIFREAHSLKGGARAVNHNVIQNICQSLENVLSSLRHNKIVLRPESFDILYATIDMIQKYLSFEGDLKDENDTKKIDNLTSNLDALSEGEILSIEKSNPISKPPEDNPQKIPPEPINTSPPLESPSKPPPVDHNTSSEPETTIRVSTHKLDSLLQGIEEMLVIKLTSGERVNDIEYIIKDLERWELERKRLQKEFQTLRQFINKSNQTPNNTSTSTIKSLLDFFTWQEEHFKTIQDKINKLQKGSAQDFRISSSIVDNLLDETKKVLMQPFSTLLEAFPRMVRDICRSLGKEVNLHIIGGEIEIDRRILEEMKDPLIHLIRNSIDHGIESPTLREELGKGKKGKIDITITQLSGSNIEICIADDGQGIDIERVKKAALKNNSITAKELEMLSDDEAVMLMFQCGVSTSEIITDLSGRGVGLGVVNEKVESLGGQIFIDTKENLGTKIRIELPITLATFRGVHILVGDQSLIIPTNYMQRVLRLSQEDIKTIEGKETITIDDQNISYIKLQDILGIPVDVDKKKSDKTIYVTVIKTSDATIALGVDKILNEQEVFIKDLGKQLTRVKNISAATVIEWGKVIPILDPFDIVKSATKRSHTPKSPLKSGSKRAEKRQTILIAEDTVTARMLLKNILDSAGYIVKTAVDGAEAYSILTQEKIDLVLSDIEMPRMNGFELTEKIRNSETLNNLPVVLCSSLSTKQDKEKGVQVGANAYIVKSNFEQSNLLETIQKLL